MSLPEVLLWVALRKRQADGLRFRRQHPLGPYILDFYCEAVRLARDERRDSWVAAQGVSTLRFTAKDVLASPEDVVATIEAAADDRGYLISLNATLSEWNTPEDAEAFDDL